MQNLEFHEPHTAAGWWEAKIFRNSWIDFGFECENVRGWKRPAMTCRQLGKHWKRQSNVRRLVAWVPSYRCRCVRSKIYWTSGAWCLMRWRCWASCWWFQWGKSFSESTERCCRTSSPRRLFCGRISWNFFYSPTSPPPVTPNRPPFAMALMAYPWSQRSFLLCT